MKASLNGLLAMASVCLLGCSTSPPAPVPIVEPLTFELPLEPVPQQDPLAGRVCQLGTSCLELDPRPFEMCLLATDKHCGEKITESVLAVNPEASEPR